VSSGQLTKNAMHGGEEKVEIESDFREEKPKTEDNNNAGSGDSTMVISAQ